MRPPKIAMPVLPPLALLGVSLLMTLGLLRLTLSDVLGPVRGQETGPILALVAVLLVLTGTVVALLEDGMTRVRPRLNRPASRRRLVLAAGCGGLAVLVDAAAHVAFWWMLGDGLHLPALPRVAGLGLVYAITAWAVLPRLGVPQRLPSAP